MNWIIAASEGIEEGVEEDYNQIISEFGDVASEVFVQNLRLRMTRLIFCYRTSGVRRIAHAEIPIY